MSDEELRKILSTLSREIADFRRSTDERLGATSAEIADFRRSTDERFGATSAEIADFRRSTDERLAATSAEIADFRRSTDERFDESRRHVDIRFEATAADIRTLAEGIGTVDSKLDRTTAELRAEMRAGFSETRAVIKFSHSELDRRVTSLEERVLRLDESDDQSS